MLVQSVPSDKIHVSETEHPAQIPVRIIQHRIAVANKPVGDFERETDLKTSFEPD